jgi:integrase
VARTGRQGRTVIETPEGITVYPARSEGDRWRAVWYENGQRQACQAASEDRLAASLEKVAVRLAAGAANMLRTGDELIAFYLSPDRHPVERQWSRKHADTQRSLCHRFLRPVIGELACEDIGMAEMQEAVNAAPTAQEGRRVRAMISALTAAGITGGYLANPRLREVHWQARGRAVAAARVVPAGESVLFVEPDEIPAAADVVKLGRAVAAARAGLYELMVYFAAYSGLRWSELAALTAAQVSQQARTVAVHRKVIEVRGHLYVEAPKNRKRRHTVYPDLTPQGWCLGERVAARIAAVGAEQDAGTNPLGLMFPAPAGGYWRSSNFRRRILESGYRAAGWRADDGSGRWTWHSLRHVFCTAALSDWRLDVTDVARLAGHSNARITWDMYIGSTSGVLDRARAATARMSIPLPAVDHAAITGPGRNAPGRLEAGELR